MSTTGAAQLEMDPREDLAARSPLKLQAAERLAAHRALRRRTANDARGQNLFAAQAAAQPQSHSPAQAPAQTRAERIAAAVAERYAHSQSYRAFLAAEAERAVQQANAAAEIAARNAQAIAAAQQQLLSDLFSDELVSEEREWALEAPEPLAPRLVEPLAPQSEPPPAAALTVRLYEESVRRAAVIGVANAVPHEPLDEEERQALDEEIAFRHAPVFEEPIEAAVPITANLIEFPRQLVAPRKARPRLAEGPLRDEAEATAAGSQLRIFEVEADQISTVVEPESSLPEWSSIRLSACVAAEPEAAPVHAASYPPPLSPAPYGLRLMAAMVDGCILLAGFLGFTATAAYTAEQVPTGQLAALGSAVVLAALFLLYQLLFFTFGEATPGMRYARIGLCTLGDDNPTRPAMRRRIGAILLAACPLGLGFLWAWLDEDGLGWHDRLSRMYQRSY